MYTSTIALLVFLFFTGSCYAFNDTGHRVVALIAWEEMKTSSRNKIIQIIKEHPRYKEDFLDLKPSDVPNKELDAWLFSQAAVWPDIARSFSDHNPKSQRISLVKKYHHGSWHYINLPLYLSEYEKKLIGPAPANITFFWRHNMKKSDIPRMNGVQCLKYSVSQINSDKKGIAIAWIFHIVGDLHQPLHSTSIYAENAFNKNGQWGDDGGGEISIKGSGKLHNMWDGAIGQGKNWSYLRKRAKDLLSTHGEFATNIANKMDIGVWVRESHEYAKNIVYSDEILKEVKQANGKGYEGKVTVTLSESEINKYRKTMKKLAARRGTVAGLRLAKLLTGL